MPLFPKWARGVFPLACLILCSVSLQAQPQLSVVQDTIYRADGLRFDGVLIVEWRSFLAADASTVSAYSKNVRVVNGLLNVSLVQTTNATTGAYYLVKYTINGRIITTEYWAIRPSTTPLKLKDVRLTGPPAAGQSSDPPVASGPVTIPDVTGLSDELAARVKKGLGYTPSRAAVINSSGDLEGASGQPTDCLRVNGTTGACAAGAFPSFVDLETPAGLVNGTNTTFTLGNAPDPVASLQLYRNGVLQRVSSDFNLSGNTITFLLASTPQAGDVLSASYRIAGSGGETGGQAAGGALSGFFPAPSIAAGAIANQHIAANAGIVESKLALNFPTHTGANDPSVDQKAAFVGTAGTPSNVNRYVTDQDSRLTNSRVPTGHGLLSGAHFDTNPGTVNRGDLLVGTGTSPTLWTRFSLGAPNRCLISNGFDVVWNACLYTGFSAGSIPFVDSSGLLANNSSGLFWDNSSRRLGVGWNTPSSLFAVHDSTAGSGVTTVTVRAGEGQSATPLQRWQNFTAGDVAKIESDGSLTAAAVSATSTSSRAAWQETGTASDPSAPANGNAWFNSTENSRKSYEAAQSHVLPQVICSEAGTNTSSTTATSLGKCTIPAAMLRTGDRFEVRVHLSHEGSAVGFTYTLNWGSQVLATRTGAAAETASSLRNDSIPNGSNLYWAWSNWGATTSLTSGAGSSSSIPGGAIDVELFGQMASSTAETITLRNITVMRLPALSN